MKKTILVILAVIILLVSSLALTACKSDDDIGVNILSNPNFEELTTSGTETGWVVSDTSTVSFVYNYHDDSYDPRLGNYYAKFNVSGAYQYITQTVSLKENAQYLITAYVKVTSVGATDNIGVRFGFETQSGTEFTGYNLTATTEDQWAEITYYFTSSEKVDAKFTIGVGSKTVNASATAYVDNVVLTRVDEIPASYIEDNTIEVLKYSKSTTLDDAGSICFVVFMALASLLIAGLVYFLIAKSMTKKEALYKEEKVETPENTTQKGSFDWNKVKKALSSELAIFIYILFGSLIVRFIVAVCTFGMRNNIDSLEALAQLGMNGGLLSFYTTNSTQTTPIGGVVTYTVLANVATWLKIRTASLGYAILMRLPQILADLVVTYMIYSFVASNKDTKQASIYSGFYAFIPLFFFFGSFYGAMESIAIAFLVGMALSILKKDYILTPVLYMCALLFSHYALVIFPVVLGFQVIGMIFDKETRWQNLALVVVCIILFYMFGFIMTFESVKSGDVFVYFKRIYQFFKDNVYLSTDSFNMYAIFGAANSKTRSTLVEVLNWLFVAGISAWPIFVYYKNRNRLDLILNAGIMLVAYALIGAGSTVVILPIGLALIMIYLTMVPDARLFLCYSVLATLSFVNIAQLASQSGYISNVTGATYTAFASNSAFLIVFSVFAVIALFFLIYVSIDITFYNQSNEIAPLSKDFKKQIKSIFVKTKDAKKTK